VLIYGQYLKVNEEQRIVTVITVLKLFNNGEYVQEPC